MEIHTCMFRFQYSNLFGMEYPQLALLCDSAAVTLNELISTLVDCVSYSLESVQISNDSSYLDSTLDDLVEVFDSTAPALNNAIYAAGHHLMYAVNFCRAKVKLVKLVKIDETDVFIVTHSGE